ncbi:helix-turn-helix domain-containing protein [Boseaceae bacterium BT-24-1]|nr:helix-turn-helix domain-containing protein [Boseaceae bacterium BT-24-1]
MMQNLADVIDAFGGYAKLAQALGCPAGTASAWKTRGSIPVRYWAQIVEEASLLGIDGVTFDALARIASLPRETPRRREVA